MTHGRIYTFFCKNKHAALYENNKSSLTTNTFISMRHNISYQVGWPLFPLCCRGITQSTRVPSRQLSTRNIKNSDSSFGKRSTFQSGSLLWSTMKQHPSSELLTAVGPTSLAMGGNGCWCLTYAPLISICNRGMPVSNTSLVSCMH